MFEFDFPWLFILLPLPLLVHWFIPAYRQSQDSIRVPFFQRLVELTGQKPQKGSVILQRVLFQKLWVPTTWILLVVAMAKPMWIGEPIEITQSARDLMVAVDLSGSMDTSDFTLANGDEISRLDAVKRLLSEFAAQRENDRLGLIVFGDSPYLQSPFTEDHSTWLTLLNETEIAMAGQSTMFGDAIGLAIKLFEGSSTENRVLIVLTDGNDTGSKVPPIEAAKVAAHKKLTIYIIAVGNPQATGDELVDMDVMNLVAQSTGGSAYQALDRGELAQAYADIARLEPEIHETLSFRPHHSLYHYPLAIAVMGYLLFFSLMSVRSQWRRRSSASV